MTPWDYLWASVATLAVLWGASWARSFFIKVERSMEESDERIAS